MAFGRTRTNDGRI